MSAWILWYHSKSHKKDRYFVGIGPRVSCLKHGFHHQVIFDYEKDNATVLDTDDIGSKTRLFVQRCGYNDLKLEKVDPNALGEKKLDKSTPSPELTKLKSSLLTAAQAPAKAKPKIKEKS